MRTIQSGLKVGMICTLAALELAGTSMAHAEESLDCLPSGQISSTKIIDDQNIVFKVRGNKFYNNHLPHKCSGLKAADKFRYTTSISKLCNVDIITVLQEAGGEMVDGAACGLGMFTPTTDPAKKAKSD